MKELVKRELIVWMQYLLIGFIAAVVAFDMWERAHLPLGPSNIAPAKEIVEAVNVKGMLWNLWHDYYRWWLVVFAGLSLARLSLIYVAKRAKDKSEGRPR